MATNFGTADNDTLSIPPSTSTWDGLAGLDTAVILTKKSGFRILTSSDGVITLHTVTSASASAGPTITLKNVEFIQFTDITLSFPTISIDSGNYTVNGTASKDTITTKNGNDTISAGAGDDRITIGGGDDTVDAGTGNDTIRAGDSADTAANAKLITGGAGSDKITLTGLAGSTIYGDGASDTGNDGKDTIKTGNGNNTIDGGGGNDVIGTGAGNDTIVGGVGDDIIAAGGGSNAVDAGAGNDVISAGTLVDTSSTTNQITGGAGIDKITIKGAAASTVYGDGATDTGNDGRDTIKTGNGNDQVYGGGGDDIIATGNSGDTLAGGTGKDKLTGGNGADVFVFDTSPDSASNVDTITDFKTGDSLELSHAIFTALAAGSLNAEDFVNTPGATAIDATDYILYDAKSGGLYYDADGSGTNLAIAFAILTGHPAIAAGDIHIV